MDKQVSGTPSCRSTDTNTNNLIVRTLRTTYYCYTWYIVVDDNLMSRTGPSSESQVRFVRGECVGREEVHTWYETAVLLLIAVVTKTFGYCSSRRVGWYCCRLT